jgi:hypothetical protein
MSQGTAICGAVKLLVEVQYLRATITQEQRDGFGVMITRTTRHSGLPQKAPGGNNSPANVLKWSDVECRRRCSCRRLRTPGVDDHWVPA